MVKVDLKSVRQVKAKGRTYYYAWRGAGAPRLYAEPGSDAFIQELHDAITERRGGDKSKIASLCARYRASDDWTSLSAKTRENWSPWLDRIQVEFGDFTIGTFDRAKIRVAIRRWRDKFKDRPRSADMALQVLSRLMSFGVAEGLLTLNPVAGIPHLYRNDRSDVIWTDDDLTLLEAHASKEVMWAANLAALTGLRQGDLLRLSWSHIGPLAIEMKTGKSRQRKTTLIPLYGSLRALLTEIPKRATTVLTNTDKVPWKTGFGSSWQAAIRDLNINKHFHDLRGTAATKLYLADFSIREIAEIMTWSEDQVERLINRYVKRDELLRDRIRRMDENDARTPIGKLGGKPT